MDESRFRALMHEAIGEESMQPWLQAAVRSRLTTRTRQVRRGRWIYVIAAALVVLVVAGFVVQRLLGYGSNVVTPTVTPSPIVSPSPVAVDPFNCRLPVTSQAGAGFIDTRSGLYTQDSSASVVGLPVDALSPGLPDFYSPALRRWLPISQFEISPDGRSYVWLKTTVLHRYYVATATDVTLWTAPEVIYVLRWDAAGIHVSTEVPSWHRGTSWVVDPVTGVATQEPQSASSFPFTLLPGDPHGTGGKSGAGFTSLGVDGEGRYIWWFYNLDYPGAIDWVFYESAPGQRVTIYRGTQGDATGFDPDAAIADSTGIWFTEQNGKAIWHWQHDSGLHKVTLSSPAALSLAGPCS